MTNQAEYLLDAETEEDAEGIEVAEPPPGLNSSAVVEVLAESPDWQSTISTISDGEVSWRPDLCGDKEDRVLHVHLAKELRPYLRERLAMAVEIGRRVVVALTLEALYKGEVVEFLGEIDAEVIVIRRNENVEVSAPRHILTTLSDCSVAVSHSTRTVVSRHAWSRRRDGSSHEKGRRFEGLLAFLLHQIADFRVVERNLRGATDEVDLVIQIDNWSTKCWHQDGVPFILVEAKNWKDPVDQAAVTVFNGKLRTKRKTARIGLLFAAGTFTSDAEMQELKFAQDPEVIVMIDGPEILRWIESPTPDDDLEQLVRRAMLR